ncbi:MAG: FtsX-like permease family protein [Mycobacteriales bacterium]
MTGGLRTALRIARRDALRHKGRSLLVLVMLGLPVLGAVGLDVIYRTSQTTPAQEATREMGRADADLTDLYYAGDKPRPPLDLTTVLPAGAHGVPTQQARRRVRTRSGVTFIRWREMDYTHPLATGVMHQHAGRAPRTSGEVAVAPRVLALTGLRVGDTLHTVGPDRAFRIVGTVVEPGDLHDPIVMARPGALLRAETTGGARIENDMLVAKPGGLTKADMDALTNAGVAVLSRESVLHPANSGQGRQIAATAVVVVGMAILEVVLLAGPAFAVGARRQQRELGVIAASGGSRRDVSAVVLASGLVMGLAAAAVGTVLGVALAWLTRPWMQDVVGQEFGPLRLRPLDLGLIAVLGTGTGMLAALFPALAAARQDPVAALAGRHGVTGTRARFPVLGAVLVAAGTLVAVVYAPGARNAPSLLAGVALVELGAILCTGALIGLIARAGRILPVSLRLALRDAARHRGRSTPAVASIMAAVAATIAVALYVQSDVAREKANYQPTLRHGQVAVVAPTAASSQQWDRVRAGIAGTLPTRASYLLSGPITPGCRDDNGCPGAALGRPGCTDFGDGCMLDSGVNGSRLGSDTLVGDADLLAAATGVRDPAAAAMLASGGAVVFTPAGVRDGQATVLLGVNGPAATIPAVATHTQLPAATLFLSPRAARTLGLNVKPIGVLVDTTRMPTQQEQQAAESAVEDAGVDSPVLVERGYTADYGPVLLALVVCSAVVTLGAAGAATGLAAADGRADLATLAAVGAAPRTRRRLASAQAAVIAGLGALFGLGIGFVPAGGLVALNRTLATNYHDGRGRSVVTLAVPWPYLALTVLVVPVLAVLCAGLLTRSRLPLVRRAG